MKIGVLLGVLMSALLVAQNGGDIHLRADASAGQAAVASAARNVLVPVISHFRSLRHACRPASPALKPTIPRQLRHSRMMRLECKAFR